METTKVNRTDDQVILDAVRLSKSDFIDLYEAAGFDKMDAGVAWHQIRIMPKGRAVMDAEYAKVYPKGIPHVRQPLSFISDIKAELEARKLELKQNKKVMTKKTADAPTAAPAKGAETKKADKAVKPKADKPAAEKAPIADGDRGQKTAKAKELIAAGETNAAIISEKSGAAIAYVRTLLYNFRKANKK